MLRRWLSRLAFSFLIIAGVLFYEGNKARERGESPTVRFIVAAVFAGAAMAGFRERHRRDPFDDAPR